MRRPWCRASEEEEGRTWKGGRDEVSEGPLRNGNVKESFITHVSSYQ